MRTYLFVRLLQGAGAIGIAWALSLILGGHISVMASIGLAWAVLILMVLVYVSQRWTDPNDWVDSIMSDPIRAYHWRVAGRLIHMAIWLAVAISSTVKLTRHQNTFPGLWIVAADIVCVVAIIRVFRSIKDIKREPPEENRPIN